MWPMPFGVRPCTLFILAWLWLLCMCVWFSLGSCLFSTWLWFLGTSAPFSTARCEWLKFLVFSLMCCMKLVCAMSLFSLARASGILISMCSSRDMESTELRSNVSLENVFGMVPRILSGIEHGVISKYYETLTVW